ncbi:hypothetical protein PINS_up005443 [Pythium insidiosum]|nr:hypothetical protein PINS_up005443 [Pythium insidiosum]
MGSGRDHGRVVISPAGSPGPAVTVARRGLTRAPSSFSFRRSRRQIFAPAAVNEDFGQHDASAEVSVVYELTESVELPVIDPSRTLKSMLLTDRQISAFNNMMARNAVLVVTLYLAATVVFFAVMIVPVAISRAFVWLHLVGQFPAMLSFTLSMRFDMLKLLCGTYNFWFLSLMNVVFMSSLSMLWLDVRILIVPMSWWEYQNAVLTDANLRNMRQVVVVSVTNIFIVGFIFFAVTLQIMPDMREALVFDGARRSLAVHEVTAHSVVTLIILLLRLAFRYRATLKNKDAKDNVIQCISYVCKVKPRCVVEHPSVVARSGSSAQHNRERRRRWWRRRDALTKAPDEWIGRRCAVKLRLVRRGHKYHSTDTVLEQWLNLRALALSSSGLASQLHTWCLHVVGGVATTLTPVSWWSIIQRRRSQQSCELVLPVVAFVLTLSVVVRFVLQYQRRVLSQLAASFDFVFLSFQFSMLLLCVCDLFQWDGAAVVSSVTLWLWIHWVLTLDALLPIHRLRWGFRIEYTTLALVMLFIAQAMLYGELMVWSALRLQDRAFLEFHIGARRVTWRVVPMLMSRMVITSVWTLRLLWRVWRRHHADELILIHGDVEYTYSSSVRLHHREQGRPAVSVVSGLSSVSGLSWQGDIEDAERSPLHTTRLATRAVNTQRRRQRWRRWWWRGKRTTKLTRVQPLGT